MSEKINICVSCEQYFIPKQGELTVYFDYKITYNNQDYKDKNLKIILCDDCIKDNLKKIQIYNNK